MNKKEKMNLLLSKVPKEQKESFVSELRTAKTGEERLATMKKYSVTLTEEEVKTLKTVGTGKVSDDELNEAAGGCCNSKCSCTGCSCN